MSEPRYPFANDPFPSALRAAMNTLELTDEELRGAGRRRPGRKPFSKSTITKLRNGENRGAEDSAAALIGWFAEHGHGKQADDLRYAWFEQTSHPALWKEYVHLRAMFGRAIKGSTSVAAEGLGPVEQAGMATLVSKIETALSLGADWARINDGLNWVVDRENPVRAGVRKHD